MVSYNYRKLDEARNQIRVVTLLPAKADKPIEIDISALSLIEDSQSSRRALSLQEVRDRTPSTWIVRETLEGRIIFESSTTDDTSWTHPDPEFDHDSITLRPEVRKNEPYEALSYVWGPLENLVSIFVREDNILKPLLVRQNLFSALQHLRDVDESKTLWIDALCINQDDDEERGRQVQKMASIYKSASRVVVWLGPEADGASIALYTMEYTGKQSESTLDHCVLRSPESAELDWFKPSTNLPYEEEVWTAIEKLLERAWFTRLWVRQEVQLANEKSVIRCGKIEILWCHFRRALLCLWVKKNISRPNLAIRLRSVGSLGEDWAQFNMIQLLRAICELQCTDRRDKVYGLLGIAPSWFTAKIKPQYLLPVGEVYKQAFLVYLHQKQRLDLLRYTLHNSIRAGTPSWVADWSIPRSSDIAANGEFASGISRAKFTIVDEDILEVVGIEYAAVQMVKEPAPQDVHLMLDFIREKWQSKDLQTSVYVTGESVETAYALALCAGRTLERFPTMSSYPKLEDWKNLLLSPVTAAADVPNLNALNRLTTKTFITFHNGYIGFGPTAALPGKSYAFHQV